MIKAEYDEKENLVLYATLIGTCKEVKTKLIIDSGFSSNLGIPTSIAVSIGLCPCGVSSVQLADGTIVTIPVFLGKVKIGDKIIDTSYLVLPEGMKECLVGRELLSNYKVCFHTAKKEITIEEKQNFNKDKHLSELKEVLHRIVPRPYGKS